MRASTKFTLALLLALIVAGCGQNYSGSGNEFKLYAKIVRVGNSSVTVTDIRLIESQGKATGWFAKNPHHQIHNNYNECSFRHSRHWVGRVYRSAKNKIDRISIRDLRAGQLVYMTGAIRENAHTCGKTPIYKWRPVYEFAAPLGVR